MYDIVIKAENLGKKYTIGHQSQDSQCTLCTNPIVPFSRDALWAKPPSEIQIKQYALLRDLCALERSGREKVFEAIGPQTTNMTKKRWPEGLPASCAQVGGREDQ